MNRFFTKIYLPFILLLFVSLVLFVGIVLNINPDTTSNLITPAIVTALFIFILASGFAFFIYKNLSAQVELIVSKASRFASGEFEQKLFPSGIKEFNSLSESLNAIARQLDEKLNIISEQKNIQQAVLASMKEGVLAVDYDERILLINKEAEEILGIGSKDITGKTLQEIVRVSEIQKFFKEIIAGGKQQETEVLLQQDKDMALQLNGTVLRDSDENSIGVIVVLNDVSNLRYLDTIKKDLVANVSHELRTPVTTIKGFIETLQEGAIDDKDDAKRFLDIIYKNIERLNMIIDDLLSLSRIEQASETNNISFKNEEIEPIISSVVEDYEYKAKKKNIKIEVDNKEKFNIRVNKFLLEQAIGNLLDNAIKYSDKKTKIKVSAERQNGHLLVSVKDEGYGIEPEDIPRLFERFYRIDKSRSRDEGGTGLGLSIVKHIVNAHGGIIEINSQIGKGSTFTINIPSVK